MIIIEKGLRDETFPNTKKLIEIEQIRQSRAAKSH